MHDIKIIFSENIVDEKKKILTNKIVTMLLERINLPKLIEIEFKNLGPSSYGETRLNISENYRISINSKLSLKELIRPLVHELLHLEQVHNQKLQVYKNGDICWEGKLYNYKRISTMSYSDYSKLPWELEVAKRQNQMLKYIVEDLQ